MQPPEPETDRPEVFEDEVNKTPEPKQWISLGSEQEIEEESIKETRQKALQYLKNTLNIYINEKKALIHICPSIAAVYSVSFCHQLSYKFSRVRRKFGAPVCFSDRNAADGYLECASYQDSRFSIRQMQRDCGMQAVPALQSSSAQTQWYASKSLHIKWICSTAGKNTCKFCQYLPVW